MARYLSRTATLIGNLPDVVHALHYFCAAGLHSFLVRHLIRDEVDVAAASGDGAVHGPEHVALVFGISQFGEGPGCLVFHPKVGCITAAIVLARPGLGVTCEGHLPAVR